MRFGIFCEHRLPRPWGSDSERKLRALLRDLAGRARTARDSLRGRGQAGLQRVIGGASDPRLEQIFGSSQAQRALFGMMTRHFDPGKAAGFDGVVVYDLGMADGTRTPWSIEVREGDARVREGVSPGAGLTVRVPLADFVRAVTTAGSFYPLIVDGRMTMDGDPALADQMAEIFGSSY